MALLARGWRAGIGAAGAWARVGVVLCCGNLGCTMGQSIIVPLIALLGLLFLAAVASGLALYAAFRRSREGRWQGAVFALLADAEKCRRDERAKAADLKHAHEADSERSRDAAFDAYLRSVAVEELDAYPGIGPATVERLQAAGYTTLAILHKTPVRSITGIGPQRLATIRAAVRARLADARHAFDAGGCKQATALAQELDQLAAKYGALQSECYAKAAAADRLISELRGRAVPAAQRVTFGAWLLRTIAKRLLASRQRRTGIWVWLAQHADRPLVPPDLLSTALPDLPTYLRDAQVRKSSA